MLGGQKMRPVNRVFNNGVVRWAFVCSSTCEVGESFFECLEGGAVGSNEFEWVDRPGRFIGR
jgi:hypothetical protein